jgi:hypothetical protein
MGYEVLDSRPRRDGPGAARPTTTGPGLPDVLTLDPGDRLSPGPDEAFVHRLSGRAVAAWHGPHRTLLVAVAALAVGGLGGGTVGGLVGSGLAVRGTQRQDAVAADLTQQRVLAVVAYAADVIRYDGAAGRTALLDVQLTNAGPRPVRVLVTPAWIEALPGHPVIRQTGRSPVASPGADLSVLMTVLAPCDDGYARSPTVPVRTLDGTVHAVPIRTGVGPLDLTDGCRH